MTTTLTIATALKEPCFGFGEPIAVIIPMHMHHGMLLLLLLTMLMLLLLMRLLPLCSARCGEYSSAIILPHYLFPPSDDNPFSPSHHRIIRFPSHSKHEH